MGWRNVTAMNSTANDYSHLKWPLTFASILTTFLAFILLLSFRSDSWFTYELIQIGNKSTISNTTRYSRLLEYGSIGLWTICNGHYDDSDLKCDLWTKENRPHSLNIIIELVSFALFLSNLTVFPSWGSSILIYYNSNNRYMRPIYGFIGILLILTFSFTVILLVTILYTVSTPFYAPGQFVHDTGHLFFQYGLGLIYVGFASFLAIICLILVILTLIWKKMIEMKLKQVDKDFLQQLSNDGYQPGWHKMVIAPRTPPTNDSSGQPPPPYEY
ncbi:unnamed protein product [Rotaria sordida]|uniref:Uncharacterized protein n=1 Tax=Rotaria sordida TaxID=392033 RepID=A0A813R6V7_9BILA|nr:unnamed protein product [Rotaria sordida]CAF0807612.1 unnamed protein product [Rotaria sordida]